MKTIILIFSCCLLTLGAYAQQPKPVTPSAMPMRIDVAKLPNLKVETLPFFKPIFSFITDKENGCAGLCSKQISFQITIIDTKDIVMNTSGSSVDNSRTYYGTTGIQFDNPASMKFLTPQLELKGDVLISENSATGCNTTPSSSGLVFDCVQPFGKKAARKFTLSISTAQDGSSTPNKLSIKIDGVGSLSFIYQTIGNSTIYANNGKQIIVITLGKDNWCSPC
jgi:hypothetical protein